MATIHDVIPWKFLRWIEGMGKRVAQRKAEAEYKELTHRVRELANKEFLQQYSSISAIVGCYAAISPKEYDELDLFDQLLYLKKAVAAMEEPPDDWYFTGDNYSPPETYLNNGPLEGNRVNLARWCGKEEDDGYYIKSLAKKKRIVVWPISPKGRIWRIWFDSPSEYMRAYEKKRDEEQRGNPKRRPN